jgi:UDP-GlcNAc:undecaprenyl-phosphate GlcNAc-1-phosphate transferase
MFLVLLSFGVAAVLTFAFIRLAARFEWVVRPRPDRWSQLTVAKFGGVPILLTAVGGAFVVPLNRRMVVLVVATAAMGILGFVDDIFPLRPLHKLIVQVAIGAAASVSGISYPLTHNPLANAVFTVAWLVGITNAFNIIDNMDGLACGVAAIALVRIGLLAGLGSPLGALLLAMIGALLGFLIFNFNPAKIFMGDTGSLGVGFFVAGASVLVTDHLSGLFSVIAVPSLILLLPVFDVLLVSATRRMSGRAVSAGAKDHTSHRLVLLGMSERNAVLLLYFFAASAGAMSYFGKADWPNLGAGVVALYLAMATLFWLYLADIEVPDSWLSQRNVVSLALPVFLAGLAQRAAIVLFDSVMLVLAMYFSFLFRLDGLTRQLTGLLLFASALSIAVRIPLLALLQGPRREWKIRNRYDVYPLVGTGLLGGLLLSGVSYFLPESKHILPAVLGLDIVFSTGLLALVRLAPSMFDDLLSRVRADQVAPTHEGLMLAAINRINTRDAIAIGSQNGKRSAFLFGIPISRASDAADLIAANAISAVYLLPECPANERVQLIGLCKDNGVYVSGLRYLVEEVSAAELRKLGSSGTIGQSSYSD